MRLGTSAKVLCVVIASLGVAACETMEQVGGSFGNIFGSEGETEAPVVVDQAPEVDPSAPFEERVRAVQAQSDDRPSAGMSVRLATDGEPLQTMRLTDLPALASQAQGKASSAGEPINLGTLSFFRDTQPGRSFARGPQHRALVVGEPQTCRYTDAESGYSTTTEAVTDVMANCVEYLAEYSKALQTECNCRLAGLNNVLYVNPDSLSYEPMFPALILFQRTDNSDNTTGFYGLLELDRSNPLAGRVRVYARDGGAACDGTHESSSSEQGSVQLTCNVSTDGPEDANGAFRMEGRFLGRNYGVLQAASADRRFLILFGIGQESFDRRLKAFQEAGG